MPKQFTLEAKENSTARAAFHSASSFFVRRELFLRSSFSFTTWVSLNRMGQFFGKNAALFFFFFFFFFLFCLIFFFFFFFFFLIYLLYFFFFLYGSIYLSTYFFITQMN